MEFLLNEFPVRFFVDIPGHIYDVIYRLNYFVFQYKLIGADGSLTIYYMNPFFNERRYFNAPALGGRLINSIVEKIEEFLNLDISLTFFEVLTGSLIFLILAYAFIKFLIPIS